MMTRRNVILISTLFLVFSLGAYGFTVYKHNKLDTVLEIIYNRELDEYKSKLKNAKILESTFAHNPVHKLNLDPLDLINLNSINHLSTEEKIRVLNDKQFELDSIVGTFWLREGNTGRGSRFMDWTLKRNLIDNFIHYGRVEKKYYPELKRILINGNDLEYSPQGTYRIKSSDTIEVVFTNYYFDYFEEKDSITLRTKILKEQVLGK